ncbi:MAG: LysM peptidoglycan-binding domain-containing protein [Bacillota bacterium]
MCFRHRAGFLKLVLCLVLLFSFSGQTLAATHTVRSGESLWKIASHYGISTGSLKAANNIKGDSIYPGQKLYVPEKGNGVYTVRPGDTLYIIASRNGIPVSQLMTLNGLKSSLIYPGQQLKIMATSPGGSLNSAGVSRGGAERGAVGNISPSEFDLLARIITAEADNQSFETKVAVGAVILNRVKSGIFPNSISGVVNQVDAGGKYQFEPVLNGWINRPASPLAIKAAREALNGVDPTGGALFFWESWVKNKFLNSRPIARVIGAFTFTY